MPLPRPVGHLVPAGKPSGTALAGPGRPRRADRARDPARYRARRAAHRVARRPAHPAGLGSATIACGLAATALLTALRRELARPAAGRRDLARPGPRGATWPGLRPRRATRPRLRPR